MLALAAVSAGARLNAAVLDRLLGAFLWTRTAVMDGPSGRSRRARRPDNCLMAAPRCTHVRGVFGAA